jgi:hypothetical protein
MTTLYLRATPSQKRILRAVEGAVKNTADAHPNWHFHPNIARAIAKRATGTLTAQWPDVLAAQMSSLSAESHPSKARPARSHLFMGAQRGGSHGLRLSPLRKLHKEIGLLAGWARKAGHLQRSAAFVDVLRLIARMERAL